MREDLRGVEEEFNQPAENFAVQSPLLFLPDFSSEVVLALRSSPNKNQNLTMPPNVRPMMGIHAMQVEFYGEEPRIVSRHLSTALRQGFAVEVHSDWFSDTVRDDDFLFFPPTRFAGREKKEHRGWVSGFTQKRVKMLEDEGAVFVTMNEPQNYLDKATYLFKNRHHKKIYFIRTLDRAVAWTGGMNLAHQHFQMIDFMVKLTDPRIVEPLIEEFNRIGENRRTQSEEVPVTQDTSLLIDSGKDDSIIYQRTIEAIDKAKESIYIMSAFHPSGKMLEGLERARKKGVHIAYITVDPKVAGGFWGAQSSYTDMIAKMKGQYMPMLYAQDRLVHGKGLVVDEKVAIVGSHNFVDMPHEELSLYSENPTLVQNLIAFFEQTVGSELLRRRVTKNIVFPIAHAA